PVCRKWDKIEISDNAIKNIKKGVLAVNVTPGMICEHSFIAYVDKNLSVRDCFIADFKIEVPENSETQRAEADSISDVDQIKFDLIKLNLPEKLMAYIFRAIFLGKNVIIISDDHFLGEQIINFFKYTSQNHFDININIMSKSGYLGDEDDYTNYLVFERNEVIHDDEKIIDPKKIGVERGIARKFLNEYNPQTGLIILRNEIKKAYEFSKTLGDFLKYHDNDTMTPKSLIKHISDVYGEKISGNYLALLLEILRNYFNEDLSKIEKTT
ncbi:MAG: hypothetical protein ACFFCI_23375, partial [Promethearchaeota archaeon]